MRSASTCNYSSGTLNLPLSLARALNPPQLRWPVQHRLPPPFHPDLARTRDRKFPAPVTQGGMDHMRDQHGDHAQFGLSLRPQHAQDDAAR